MNNLSNKVCKGCGKDFSSPIKATMFCSRSCAAIHRKPVRRPWDGKTRPDMKGDKHPMFGKKHSRETREKVRDSTLKQWSRGDFAEWTKQRRENPLRGPAHFNYKNGSAKLRAQICNSSRYRQWRAAVFKKYDHRCMWCGYRDQKLEAHHSIPVRTLIKVYEIKTAEDAFGCEEFWDVKNGWAVCHSCHSDVDEFRRRPKCYESA